MTNLVPLYIDKETGEIVATGTGGSGGGGGGGTSNVIGYVHNQPAATNQWVIVHNKNSMAVMYQVYTSTLENIMPDRVTIDTPDQITVHLDTAMAGYAHLFMIV